MKHLWKRKLKSISNWEDQETHLGSLSGDKVQDAIASNPKLAALFQNIDNIDEEEEEDEWMDTTTHDNMTHDRRMDESEDDDDDEPLFLPHDTKPAPVFRPDDLLEDMDAYADDNDEAMQAVLHQIYADEANFNNETMTAASPLMDTTKEQELPDETHLDPDQMYNTWLSKVPDAFIYLHSMNDEYKQIIHDTIYDLDIDHLEKQLKRVQKSFGKTNDRDEMAQEALSFQEQFLSAVIDWKKVTHESATLDHHSPTPEDTTTATEHVNASTQPEKPIDVASSPESVHILDEGGSQDIITIDEYERQKATTLKDDAANVDENIPSDNDPPHDVVNTLTHDEDPTISPIATKDLLDQIPAEDGITSTDTGAIVEEHESSSKVVEEAEQMATEAPDELQYGYNSDEELVDKVEAEEDEYARFVSDIAQKDLESVRDELYKDMKELNKQQRKEMGNTDEITRQMTQDIQVSDEQIDDDNAFYSQDPSLSLYRNCCDFLVYPLWYRLWRLKRNVPSWFIYLSSKAL